MPLRARKRKGPLSLGTKSASLRLGGRGAHVSTSTSGRVQLGVRLLPGISWWKRLK